MRKSHNGLSLRVEIVAVKVRHDAMRKVILIIVSVTLSGENLKD